MTSLFSTSATLRHATPLPQSSTLPLLLRLIHNHDLLIRLDPELSSYTTLPTPADAPAPHTKLYRVTDVMHTLPRGLWDTTVSFDAQMTDSDEGLEWIIRAPLGLVQKSLWRVFRGGETTPPEAGAPAVEGELKEGERWWLVEEVEIKGSRLIVGTVKAKCESNWSGIHGAFVKKVEEEIAKEAGGAEAEGDVSHAAKA